MAQRLIFEFPLPGKGFTNLLVRGARTTDLGWYEASVQAGSEPDSMTGTQMGDHKEGSARTQSA
jgi:hypothetical protein